MGGVSASSADSALPPTLALAPTAPPRPAGRVCRAAGSCRAQAACDGAALTKKRHGPWAGSKAPTTCSWTPRRRRPGAPGEHKFPGQESLRGGVPLPRAEVAPVRPGARPSPSARLAPCLAGAPSLSLLGTPGNPRSDPRSLRGRPARMGVVPSPRPLSAAPRLRGLAQAALEDAPGRGAPSWLRGEDSSPGKGQVCARRGPGKTGRSGETRAEGGRRGARGRRAGEKRGRSGAPVTHPRSPPGAHRSG